MLSAAIAIAVALTTVSAYAQAPYAQILRCVDADGNVEYRSSPCPAGAREGVVIAKKSTAETSTGEPSTAETSAGEIAPIRRRAYISPERKQALDVAERYAAVARAARPQVAVQVLPLPPAK